jgi:parallel beta-helix repeat protein
MRTQIFIISIIFLVTMASISSAVQSNKSVIQNNSLFVDSLSLKDPCKILFIGSSYFNFNNLPGLFEQLTRSAGKDVYIDHIGKNGIYLDDHASSALTELKINETDWDYIVLQGVGSLMAYPAYFTDHSEYPALETLWYKIHRHCESTKMVYCMPWAFEDGMTWYQNWTDTYEDMQLKIYETTLNYSRNIGFMIAPVGWVWYAVLKETNYPLHYLHLIDWNHPSLKGSYLMSCVLYSTLFQKSSVGLSNISRISENETIYFQTIASHIVLNNRNLWNIDKKPPLYVDDDNTAGPWDGSIDYPFQHIQNAIDNASESDTVYVYNGTYYENIVINTEGLTLTGENKYTTKICSTNITENTTKINAVNVTIQGFTIENATGTNILWDTSGVYICSSNAVIRDNVIRDNRLGLCTLNMVYNVTICDNSFVEDGILFGNYQHTPTNPTVTLDCVLYNVYNNTVNEKPLYYFKNINNLLISDNAGEIILVNCTNVTIEGTYLTQCNFPIMLYYCNNCLVENNTVENSYGEVLTMHSENCTFQHNTIDTIIFGVCLDQKSNNIMIRYNKVSNSNGGVVVMIESKNNVVYENTFYNNTLGIGLRQRAYNNTFFRNVIEENDIGLYLTGGPYNNFIENNTFIDNVLQVQSIGKTKNYYNNNYWNRPRMFPKLIFGWFIAGQIIPMIPCCITGVDKNPLQNPPIQLLM